jgi:hypothetical protein
MGHSTEALIHFLSPVAYLQLDTGLVQKQTPQPLYYNQAFFLPFFLSLTLFQSRRLYTAPPLSANSAHHDVIALRKLRVFDRGYILAYETEKTRSIPHTLKIK